MRQDIGKHVFSMIVFATLVVILVASCTKPENKAELYVSAAVSLKDVLKEIGANFEAQHKNARVVYNFGASGLLAEQILQGAPADVFVSASNNQIDLLSKKELLLPDSLRECGRNRLVVISSRKEQPVSLADLPKLERIAIGNPKTVPAGEYARQALEKEKLYDKLLGASKLVLAEDARQILSYVEGGDVEAGIVYNTDAIQSEKAKICFVIDKSLSEPIRYEIVCLKNASQPKLAASFVEFVTSSQSKELFEKRGFLNE